MKGYLTRDQALERLQELLAELEAIEAGAESGLQTLAKTFELVAEVFELIDWLMRNFPQEYTDDDRRQCLEMVEGFLELAGRASP